MIIEPTLRLDGFYQFGDRNDENLDIWAAYYKDDELIIIADSQITIDPAYFIEGAIQDGYSGLASLSSREDLISELEARGFIVI